MLYLSKLWILFPTVRPPPLLFPGVSNAVNITLQRSAPKTKRIRPNVATVKEITWQTTGDAPFTRSWFNKSKITPEIHCQTISYQPKKKTKNSPSYAQITHSSYPKTNEPNVSVVKIFQIIQKLLSLVQNNTDPITMGLVINSSISIISNFNPIIQNV